MNTKNELILLWVLAIASLAWASETFDKPVPPPPPKVEYRVLLP